MLLIGAIPDLGIGAVHFVSNIKQNSGVIDLCPTAEMVEIAVMVEFVILAELGLFTRTGDRYQLPEAEVRLDRVRAIALKLAETEDQDRPVYPKHFVAVMARHDAEKWQRRLSVMDESQRCADRTVLLGNDV